jgi:hypothetical protein
MGSRPEFRTASPPVPQEYFRVDRLFGTVFFVVLKEFWAVGQLVIDELALIHFVIRPLPDRLGQFCRECLHLAGAREVCELHES